jgi:hypothetical protein
VSAGSFSAGCKGNPLPPSIAKVKNAWIYASTPVRLCGPYRNNAVVLIFDMLHKRVMYESWHTHTHALQEEQICYFLYPEGRILALEYRGVKITARKLALETEIYVVFLTQSFQVSED